MPAHLRKTQLQELKVTRINGIEYKIYTAPTEGKHIRNEGFFEMIVPDLTSGSAENDKSATQKDQ